MQQMACRVEAFVKAGLTLLDAEREAELAEAAIAFSQAAEFVPSEDGDAHDEEAEAEAEGGGGGAQLGEEGALPQAGRAASSASAASAPPADEYYRAGRLRDLILVSCRAGMGGQLLLQVEGASQAELGQSRECFFETRADVPEPFCLPSSRSQSFSSPSLPAEAS